MISHVLGDPKHTNRNMYVCLAGVINEEGLRGGIILHIIPFDKICTRSKMSHCTTWQIILSSTESTQRNSCKWGITFWRALIVRNQRSGIVTIWASSLNRIWYSTWLSRIRWVISCFRLIYLFAYWFNAMPPLLIVLAADEGAIMYRTYRGVLNNTHTHTREWIAAHPSSSSLLGDGVQLYQGRHSFFTE